MAQSGDIKTIAQLALEILDAFPEDEKIFAERIRLSPKGCFVLDGKAGILGYAISHPWRRRSPPHLNSLIGAIPDNADCWYIHDVSISPKARGSGAGAAILNLLENAARQAGLSVAALVAVDNSSSYWGRFGFRDQTTDALRPTLKSYDEAAIYMEKDLI